MGRLKALRIVCLVLAVLLPGWAFSGAAHDFHVSVMRVDYNAKAQSLEVAVKVFAEDLERSLELLGAQDLRLGSAREDAESDAFISKYLNNRIDFFVNGEQKPLIYVGKEVEVDVVWCYFEVKEIAQLKDLRIRNVLLMEQFDDQSNLVHIYAGGSPKSMLLRKGFEEDTVHF